MALSVLIYWFLTDPEESFEKRLCLLFCRQKYRISRRTQYYAHSSRRGVRAANQRLVYNLLRTSTRPRWRSIGCSTSSCDFQGRLLKLIASSLPPVARWKARNKCLRRSLHSISLLPASSHDTAINTHILFHCTRAVMIIFLNDRYLGSQGGYRYVIYVTTQFVSWPCKWPRLCLRSCSWSDLRI